MAADGFHSGKTDEVKMNGGIHVRHFLPDPSLYFQVIRPAF